MNRNLVAKELVRVSRLLTAKDFPSERALKKYLKEHPAADRRRHKVVKHKPGDSSKVPTSLRPQPKKIKKLKPKPKPLVPTGDFKTFKTDKEAQAYGEAKFAGWNKKLSGNEKDSLWRYQGASFERINTAMRSGKKQTGRVKEVIDDVASAIQKGGTPENLTVWRGYNPSGLVKDWKNAVGKTYTDKAFVSTSLQKGTGEYFAKQSKGVLAEIRLPKGSKGAWMGKQTGNIEEAEFLLPANTKLQVIEASMKNGKYHVVMVPEKAKEREFKPTPEVESEKPKKKSPTTTPHTKVKVNSKAVAKVQKILSSNSIEKDSDELQELAGFKGTLGQRVPEVDAGKFFVRNERKLKSDFVKNMNPDNYPSPEAFTGAKKRIMDMSVGDFGKVLAALTGKDEEE